jgi:glycerophosphoryl diester phosphodiesterase
VILKLILLALAFAGSFSLCAAAIEIVAHRGASHDAPENTVGALKLGFTQGADAGECDIHLTSDGELMVMHDASALRTTGASNLMARTASSELRKLEAGQWGKWKGSGYCERIPFLREVLAVTPEGKRLFIEIKCGAEALPALDGILALSGKKPDQIVIICFDYEVIKAAKRRMPQHPALWLVSQDAKTKAFAPVETLIARCKDAGLDGLDLNSGFPTNREFVSKVHEAGLTLHTWTVDDPVVARRHAEARVDGITTNRPEWLRARL